jgi:PDZ domain-containing protein
VAGNVPDGIEVFAVSTLDEARDVVETIGDGGDTSDFATCETG